MKRKEGISTEEFRRFWNSPEFNGLIDSMTQHALTAEVRKNLTLDIDLNKALQVERDAKPAFDGVLEILWPSGGDVAGLVADDAFQQLMGEMEVLQEGFIDFQESRRFFTEYVDDRA
jgi:hypothetical protein